LPQMPQNQGQARMKLALHGTTICITLIVSSVE
jgi:hypothetical protein